MPTSCSPSWPCSKVFARSGARKQKRRRSARTAPAARRAGAHCGGARRGRLLPGQSRLSVSCSGSPATGWLDCVTADLRKFVHAARPHLILPGRIDASISEHRCVLLAAMFESAMLARAERANTITCWHNAALKTLRKNRIGDSLQAEPHPFVKEASGRPNAGQISPVPALRKAAQQISGSPASVASPDWCARMPPPALGARRGQLPVIAPAIIRRLKPLPTAVRPCSGARARVSPEPATGGTPPGPTLRTFSRRWRPLSAVAEPPRRTVPPLNRAAGGTAALCAADACSCQTPAGVRRAVRRADRFICCRRHGSTPVSRNGAWTGVRRHLLEQIIQHEAVHAIDGWTTCAAACSPIVAASRSSSPTGMRHPLIFVGERFVAAMPDAIAPLIDKNSTDDACARPRRRVLPRSATVRAGRWRVIGNF